MSKQTDHLVYLGHGSAQHSVVDQSLLPAGCDTPPSCSKINQITNKYINKL